MAAGYVLVPFGDAADLGVIHTCTVTREADAKSRKKVRQFIRKNPGAYTAVIGCYAQMGAETLSAIEGVDLIVGNQEKLNILDYVAAGKGAAPVVVRDRILRDDFSIDFCDEGMGAAYTRRANLKIQDGCDFMCGFCVVPFARGRARSREMDNLLAEARSLVRRGAKELVLTGVNVGTYAWRGTGIVAVIERLNAIEGVERIRISSIEPTTVPLELFDLMNDPEHALLPYLHIPLQSGSDVLLQAMGRKYSRAEWLEFLALAQTRVPDIGLGTDVLVGFPGETEADFADTLDLLDSGPVFYAHVFKYSERAGTASVRMQGKVDAKTANARGARVRKLSAEKTRAFGERRLGRVEQVLFEHCQGGHWTGYAGNFVRVAARCKESMENKIMPVRLRRICGDLVEGELLDAVSEAPALHGVAGGCA